VKGVITATVSTAPIPPSEIPGTRLTSSVPKEFSIGPVTSPSLLNKPEEIFAIVVPQNATRLTVKVATSTPKADVDLHVGYSKVPNVAGGRSTADYISDHENSGDEQVVVSIFSNPPLLPGVYFIALALYTTNVKAVGTITATIEAPNLPPAINPPSSADSGGSRVSVRGGSLRTGSVSDPPLRRSSNLRLYRK
jgi:hypothetical protein